MAGKHNPNIKELTLRCEKMYDMLASVSFPASTMLLLLLSLKEISMSTTKSLNSTPNCRCHMKEAWDQSLVQLMKNDEASLCCTNGVAKG